MQPSPSLLPSLSFQNSIYSYTPFHALCCSYSNESFRVHFHEYQSSYPIYQSYVNSTPYQINNLTYLSSAQNFQLKQCPNERSSPRILSARKRISDEAIEHLNAFYAINKRPTDAEKDRLAAECNITLTQVSTWFNNARSRRGHTRAKLTEKLLKKKIGLLNNEMNSYQHEQKLFS